MSELPGWKVKSKKDTYIRTLTNKGQGWVCKKCGTKKCKCEKTESLAKDLLNQLLEARPPTGSWIVGGVGRENPDNLWTDAVIVVVDVSYYDIHTGSRRVKRIGIGGAGEPGSYGEVGSKAPGIYRDYNMSTGGRSGYQEIGDGDNTIVAYVTAPYSDELRRLRVRSLYHFD